jgi:putative transposase
VRATGNGAIGLDFGLHHAVAMSDGTIIDAPKFLAKAAKEIKALNKEKRRKRSPKRKKKIKASKGCQQLT